MWPHRARVNTSDMACVHLQQGGYHNTCSIPTKMGMISESSGSIEMALLCLLHDVLHATVFWIIGIATQEEGK